MLEAKANTAKAGTIHVKFKLGVAAKSAFQGSCTGRLPLDQSICNSVETHLDLERIVLHEALDSLVGFQKSLTERTPPGPTAYDEGFDKYPLFNSTVTAKPSSVNHNWDLPPPK